MSVARGGVVYDGDDIRIIVLHRNSRDVARAHKRAEHRWQAILDVAVGFTLGAVLLAISGFWFPVLVVTVAVCAFTLKFYARDGEGR